MTRDEELTLMMQRYRTGLIDDVIPFWLKHSLDTEHGGIFTSLGRDGRLIDTDKAVWAQGRCAWMMSTLAATVEPKEEWLEAARSCLTFLQDNAFDDDGQMLFLLTRDGRPLRKRRYAFSEAFACMGHAAFAAATGNDAHGDEAIMLFEGYVRRAFNPSQSTPKVNQQTRPTKSIGPVMIGINLAQTLRSTIGLAKADMWIDRWIMEIEDDFYHPELSCLLETVTTDGSLVDHFDGRTLNPGHALEAANFILHEARFRGGDRDLITLGTDILDCMWKRGWDEEHGGLFYFRDLNDGPLQEYWHDMKFWWPHNEAIIATLLASHLTGEERYFQWHRQIHDWAHDRFADPQHGEWFGYLHRDGSVSTELKGNHWKGPFHLPRMQLYCWQLISEMLDLPTAEAPNPE